MRICKGQMVRVEWLDSRATTDQWEFLEDAELEKPVCCVSVGIVLEDTREYIVIAQSKTESPADETQIMGRMTIPRCSITKERILK